MLPRSPRFPRDFSLAHRALMLAAAVAVCAVSVSATSHHTAGAPARPGAAPKQTPALAGAYFAEFSGVGAEGRDMVWRGAAAGASVGEMTLRLAHQGADIDTAQPLWPVEGIVFVSGEDPTKAFAAEVRGTIDWTSKRLVLDGEVSVGFERGARLDLTGDFIGVDLSGDLHFTERTLASAR